jgi:hypothetical protein
MWVSFHVSLLNLTSSVYIRDVNPLPLTIGQAFSHLGHFYFVLLMVGFFTMSKLFHVIKFINLFPMSVF